MLDPVTSDAHWAPAELLLRDSCPSLPGTKWRLGACHPSPVQEAGVLGMWRIRPLAQAQWAPGCNQAAAAKAGLPGQGQDPGLQTAPD